MPITSPEKASKYRSLSLSLCLSLLHFASLFFILFPLSFVSAHQLFFPMPSLNILFPLLYIYTISMTISNLFFPFHLCFLRSSLFTPPFISTKGRTYIQFAISPSLILFFLSLQPSFLFTAKPRNPCSISCSPSSFFHSVSLFSLFPHTPLPCLPAPHNSFPGVGKATKTVPSHWLLPSHFHFYHNHHRHVDILSSLLWFSTQA